MFPTHSSTSAAYGYGTPYWFPTPTSINPKKEPFESPANSPNSSKRRRVTDGQLCVICEEPAKGFNYGVSSCLGCKTFFRRTVLSVEIFVCQKEGSCDVTSHMRNACRKCRFDKCMRFGMDVSALSVGNDKRSNIIKMPTRKEEASSTPSRPPQTPRIDRAQQLTEQLTRIEMCCNDLRTKDLGACGTLTEALSVSSCIFRMDGLATDAATVYSALRPATMQDIQAWNIREMRLCVEWAKAFSGFQTLFEADKAGLTFLVYLVKNFAMSFNVLNRVFYSKFNEFDAIVYPSGAYIAPHQDDFLRIPACTWSFDKQIKELMLPLRELEIGLPEFALFKALLFFDPHAFGLTPEAKLAVKAERQQFTTALFRALSSKHGLADGIERYSTLLLRATPLHCIVAGIEANMHLMHVFDHFWPIDDFVKEACMPTHPSQPYTLMHLLS